MRALSARFMQLERGEVTHRPISDTRFVERLSNASCSATSFVDPNEHFSHTPIFWVFCLHLTRPCCLHGGNMQHRWRRRCSEPAVLCSTCAMLTNMLTFASLFCRRIYFSRSLSSCSLGFYIQQTMFNISACSSTSSEAPVCHIPHADLWLGTLAKLLYPPSKGWSRVRHVCKSLWLALGHKSISGSSIFGANNANNICFWRSQNGYENLFRDSSICS